MEAQLEKNTKENSIKFSVIVPVYNIEKYVEECILSVKNQSYSNWELILIDDGSKDNSGEVCKKHICEKTIYYYQDNSGVSCARNIGLQKATGDYVLFIDGDDLLRQDALEILVNYANKNIDIINYTWQDFYVNGQKDNSLQTVPKDFVFKDFTSILNIMLYNNYLGSVCTKAFKKNILKELQFKEGMIFLEDQIFCLEAFEKSENTVFLNDYLYLYRIRKSGAVKSFNLQKITDSDILANFLQDKAKEYNVEIDEEKFALRAYTQVLGFFMQIINLNKEDKKEKSEQVLKSKNFELATKLQQRSYFQNKLITNGKTGKTKKIITIVKQRELLAKLAGKRKNQKHCFT